MSVANIIEGKSIPSLVELAEKETGFKRGFRMHAFDGGIYVDVFYSKKGYSWWVFQDKGPNTKKIKKRPLTKEYWEQTYELNR